MKKTIPIIHSVLDAAPLAELVERNYDLPGPIHAELLTRGMNDVYEVRDGSGRLYALRVWRHLFRNEAEVNYETAYLAFLDGAGIPVSTALTTRNGSRTVPVRAMEGPRHFALFRWADGTTFAKQATPALAHKLGALIARMHAVGGRFRPDAGRVVDSQGVMRRDLPHIQRMVAHRPGEAAYYADVADRIWRKFEDVRALDLPRGPTHGDFHAFNAFVAPGDKITLLDFDNCGTDYLLAELASFAWANEYVKQPQAITDAFHAGYESVRPLTPDEKALWAFFYLAKEVRFLFGFAANVNAVGHTPLMFPDLDWFYASIRRHVNEAGI